jgi:hypothetical protein
MVIFKGKENGRIVTKELPTYSSECIWAAQKNAWCDERCMMMWVDGCLKPWKEELAATLGPIMPILILDAYRVHMMASVVNYIQGLGIEVIHIPGGCTYLCQPLDVGVNRPLKRHLTESWESWMEMEGITTLAKPSRKQIGEWFLDAYKNLEKKTIVNAWKKKGFEWW